MRKIVTLFAVLTFVKLFSQSWYDSNGFAEVIKPLTDSKNSEWKGYSFSFYYALNIISERAVYFDVNDFGLDYPVTLQAVRTYLYEDNYSFNYKIYAKDGITVLFQSQSNSVYGKNEFYLTTTLVLSDDFWVAIVPYEEGHPFQLNSDEVVETHSYSGGAGNWVPFKYENIKYEHIIHALLSPYEGEDTYPPNIVTVSGTEFYMNTDAVITLTVSDQNQVISPMLGEYSFDGGTVWTSFQLLSSKDSFTFSGTIPGQPDGTTGKIRFNPVDNLGHSRLSEEYPISWSKDYHFFKESFEGDPLETEGWSVQTTGAGWLHQQSIPAYTSVHTGSYSMAHLDDMGAQDDWLISPVITLPSDSNIVISYWETSMFVQYIGTHEVCVTNDGGATWTRIISNVPEEYKFNQVFCSLSAYNGQNIQLGWHYTGDYSDQWFIDDVEIYIDDKQPEIIKIVSDTSILPVIGAFVNKNMEINLSVYDISTVNSVKGHYSFNDEAVTDVDMISIDGNEKWSYTIPARNSIAAGTINFDITDVAGNTLNSEDYTIKFVADTWEPVIESLIGTTVQINEDLNLHLTFFDHNAVISCTGFFSEDGFLTQYEFELTKDSKNVFEFYGTVPAEAELTEGEVKFTAEDSFGNILNSSKFKVDWINVLPKKFDLRTSLDKNYVTPVKLQFYGTCYDYAANSAIESNLLMTGNWESAGEAGVPDLSESHLSWWFGFNQFYNGDIDPPTGDGLTTHLRGDYLLVSAYLTRGEGAVREIDASSFTVTPDRFSKSYHYFYPRNIEWYTMDHKLNGIDLIKQKIATQGVIGTSLAYDPIFMDSENFTHYQPPDVQYFITHCVSIVGWDDNKVTQAPQGPGAWYCKNSYGPDYGFEGYFWISYYDQHAGREWEGGTVSFQNVEKMKYDAVYYHDYHGWSDTMKDTKEAFNAFTLKDGDNGKLAALSFYTSIDDVEYTAKIYKSFTEGQLSDQISTVSGSIKYRGFHTVDLDIQPHISKGEKFYIYLYLSQGGQAYDQSSTIPSALTAPYRSSASSGESFYLENGVWKDLFDNNTIDKPKTANFCIKGLIIRDTVSMEENLPETTALYQNYPNPFNPSTRIKYAVVKASHVQLNIYNIKGQLVRNMVNSNQEPGIYVIDLNADDLSAGIYFYSLETKNSKLTRKMLLIK